MNGLASSVNRFRFRIGASAVFDADDARQEARIAMWLAGDDRAVVGYRAILDALRMLKRGWRYGSAMVTAALDSDITDESPGPEEIAIRNQQLRRVREVLTQREFAVVDAVLRGEDAHTLAHQYSVSEAAVSQWLKAARAKLESTA